MPMKLRLLSKQSLMGLPSLITFHLILTTALAKEKHKFSLNISYPDIALEKLHRSEDSPRTTVDFSI